MNAEQREELDRQLTTPPHDCEEDGHDLQYLGSNSEGDSYYRCRRCGMEGES